MAEVLFQRFERDQLKVFERLDKVEEFQRQRSILQEQTNINSDFENKRKIK